MAKIPTKYNVGDVLVFEHINKSPLYTKILAIKNRGAKERHVYEIKVLRGEWEGTILDGQLRYPLVFIIDTSSKIRLASDMERLLYA